MKILEKFIINKDVWIEVILPSECEKINYFYEPTLKLHKFDEATVYLKREENSTIIARDAIQEIVAPLWKSLYNSLHGKNLLSEGSFVGKVGWLFNKDAYALHCVSDEEIISYEDTLDYSSYWLWSSTFDIETWMYTHNNKIYIEIAPIYDQLYLENFKRDDEAFEAYISNYKPLLCTEVSYDEAERWLKKCEDLIKQIDSDYVFNKS